MLDELLKPILFSVWGEGLFCIQLHNLNMYFMPVSVHVVIKTRIACSIDEWAYYDAPAMIDFVHNHTNYEKMYLVTYSMSSTIFLATASARPEYNDKIIVSYHMAPFVAYTHIKSLLVRLGIQLGQLYLVSVFITYTNLFFFFGLNSAAYLSESGFE